jgi:hypothetical protein
VATGKGDLASLGARQALAGDQLKLASGQVAGDLAALDETQNIASMQRGLQYKQLGSELANFDTNQKLSKELKKVQIQETRANAARYFAEAAKMDAMSRAGGVEPDKATLEWEKSLGDLAGTIGKTPAQIRELFQSGALGAKTDKSGKQVVIPLATELAAMAQNIKKPEFWINPYEDMSPELAQWMGGDVLARMQDSYADPDSISGEGDGVTPPAAEKPSGPLRIDVDKEGNIIRQNKPKEKTGKPSAAAPAAMPGPVAQSNDSGIDGGDLAVAGGAATLALLANPKFIDSLKNGSGAAAKALANAWEGRGAGGKFTGKALKTLPKRALTAAGTRGLAAAAGPVGALSLADMAVGQYGSAKYTNDLPDENLHDLSALTAISLAATGDSFDRQAKEAKADELSSRVNMILRSPSLTDEQKTQELAMILQQREALLKELNTPQGSRGLMPPPVMAGPFL